MGFENFESHFDSPDFKKYEWASNPENPDANKAKNTEKSDIQKEQQKLEKTENPDSAKENAEKQNQISKLSVQSQQQTRAEAEKMFDWPFPPVILDAKTVEGKQNIGWTEWNGQNFTNADA